MMYGAREEFLAGATLAEQQYGGFGGSGFLQLGAYLLHRRGFSNDAREAVANGEFLAQDQVFPEKLLLTGGPLDEQFQMVEVHRLLNKIESAFLHGRNGFIDGAEGG